MGHDRQTDHGAARPQIIQQQTFTTGAPFALAVRNSRMLLKNSGNQ
jgi:hypothetical protein